MNRAAVTVRPPAAFGARPRTQAKVCVREKNASGIFLRRPSPHVRRSAPRAAESQWVGRSATTNFTSDRSIGLNWYAYANGNPINFADPTGYGASRVLDAMQGGLTALGFAPGVGAVADLVNAGISAGRGDFVGAGFNLASSLPGLGDAFAAGKIATAAVGVAVAKSASHAVSSTAATAAKVEAAVVTGAKTAGSTADLAKGTTLARNLREQLAIEQAMSRPAAGQVLPIKMTDPRWPASDGWVKMQQMIRPGGEPINVHYIQNTATGAVDDFKIVIPGARP